MPIVVPARAGDTAEVRFRPAPWHDDHPDRLDLDRRLPPDHLARRIAAAVDRLDLRPLRAAYGGTGSAPYPPPLLLPPLLYEAHPGCPPPPQWHPAAHDPGPAPRPFPR